MSRWVSSSRSCARSCAAASSIFARAWLHDDPRHHDQTEGQCPPTVFRGHGKKACCSNIATPASFKETLGHVFVGTFIGGTADECLSRETAERTMAGLIS